MTQEQACRIFGCLADPSRLRIVQALSRGDQYTELLAQVLCLSPSTVSFHLKKLQDANCFTRLMVLQEELKIMPFGEVWKEYCRLCGKPLDGEWYAEIERYEKNVLEARR